MPNKPCIKVLKALACDYSHQESSAKGSLIGIYATNTIFAAADLQFAQITFWVQFQVEKHSKTIYLDISLSSDSLLKQNNRREIFNVPIPIPPESYGVMAVDLKDVMIPIRPPDKITLMVKETGCKGVRALELDIRPAQNAELPTP